MVSPALVLVLLVSATPTGRAEYRRASKLYAAAEYEAALPHFRKAYRRSGHRPSTTFGLAQCERMLGMYEQAERHLQEFLTTAPVSRQDRGRKLLAKVRAALQAQEPQVIVELPPPQPELPSSDPPPMLIAQVAAPAPAEPLLSKPLFWVVSATVFIAGAVGLGLIVTRDGEQPYGGSSGQVFSP